MSHFIHEGHEVARNQFLVVFLLFAPAAVAQEVSHPLDPLSKAEIEKAVNVLKSSGKLTSGSRFPMFYLKEPAKEEALNYQPGKPLRREAFAVVYERAANKTFEAVVDLPNNKLASWKEIPGVQPNFMMEDFQLLQEIVRADPGWQQAMRRRGITDFQNVQLDPWSAGNFGFPEEEGVRVFRAVACYRGKAMNCWAHPIEGLVAYVDMNKKKVLKLVDSGVVPVSRASGEFDERSVGRLREAPRPLEIVQGAGPSFQTHGQEVRWQKWRFRWALHPREGVVLYAVGYEDEGKLRRVLYRASLSEMIVPYGDTGPSWFFRSVFDEGEYGLGKMVGPHEPRLDAPANAVFFDTILAGEAGKPETTPRAVALYERDGGILWKHLDNLDTQRNESRRARELVLSSVATVGNYEYGFHWVFHQDGSLEMDILLSGIMQTQGVASGSSTDGNGSHAHSHLVAPQVAAVHHQHFFNFRLDLDVDGAANRVVEMNTEALPPGPANPYGNGFAVKETVLHSEREAQRKVNPDSNRRWVVVNPSVANSLGQPVGYMLVPGPNGVPFADPKSQARRRAGFLNAHLWATPYAAEEMNAAGFYINQSRGGDGLPKWTAGNRSLEGKDVVLWYTMGITHIPRPEEWPVMTVQHAGFRLIPNSFFARNPALDVPKSSAPLR